METRSTPPLLPRVLAPRLRRAAAVAALLVAPVLHADETTILGEPPTRDAAATITALEEESRRAVIRADYATLERLWSERFVVNHPGNAVAPSRAAVFELFRQLDVGGRLYSRYDKEIECITFNRDLAIVMGVDTVARPNAPTTAEPAQRRYTNIWRFENGRWLLIARQATMLAPGASSGPPRSPQKP